MARRRKGPDRPRRVPRAALATLLLGVATAGAVGAWWLWARPSRRPNVVLITIDTLRADRLGVYGYAPAATPVLDGLARRGVRFEQAEASIPLTGPSHATILTGHYPPVHGVRDNVVFPLGDRHPTLATQLQRGGYRTAAFVAAYPVAAAFGFAQGFDVFDEGFHESPIPGEGAERPGNEVADAALKWIGAGGASPFFLWLHFYDPHTPYHPPAAFASAAPGRPYDGEIAFTDAQVGRVLDGLRAAGHADDSVVAVVADHGESLGEHAEQTHAILVYESTLRVPFFLAGPGLPAGRVVSERVGTVDVTPTLLALAGLPVPDGLLGRDLGPALRGEPLAAQPIYAESLFGRLNCRWASLRVLFDGDWKLIEGREPELYDLARDPGETKDRAADEPRRLGQMRAGLRAAMARMAPSGDAARSVAVSPQQLEKLRSLGYTGGGSAGSAPLDDRTLPDPRTHVQLYETLQKAMLARGPAAPAALRVIEEVARRDPGNPYAHFALGGLAYREGQLSVAAAAYARGLELDPDRPGMRLPYGNLLRDMRRFEESERHLRIALEQTTADDHRTRIGLARTLLARGQTPEARKLLAGVLAKAPEHVEALAAQGELEMEEGRPAQAVPLLEKAAGGQANPEPWVELAQVHIALGDGPAAARAAARALELSPRHPWAMAMQGHALLLSGRRAEGLEVLHSAVAARPRRPDAWLSLARAFDAAGDPARAAACRRQAEAIGHTSG
jgi:arylsulfatase A-like enzyme/tetratricopeptide (TPR) repeat protein